MPSAAATYRAPGIGTIDIAATDGQVVIRRSIAGRTIETVSVLFLPDEDRAQILREPDAPEGGRDG